MLFNRSLDKPSLVYEAKAKVNVGLRILGQRPDGYHEIWSILQEINLTDEIWMQDASDLSFSLTCNQKKLPTDDQNLCIRAAKLLHQVTGYPRGVALRLVKRIPIGAGLGGGSSDAAAVLKGLNELWQLSLSQDELLELASQLGSDVPFFIMGSCCVAT
ncbi:MAG: 4-(cytidine 5'-diphospho)-2-C-methyl-D-erythritol kinase, partial [bacterium]